LETGEDNKYTSPSLETAREKSIDITLGKPLATASTTLNIKRFGFSLIAFDTGRVNRMKNLRGLLIGFLEDIAPKGYVEDWTQKHIEAYHVHDGHRRSSSHSRWEADRHVCRGEEYSPYTAIFVRNRTDWQGDEFFAFTS
jgi:hypothetical protein